MPTRLAVLISGNGSNLQAILDAIRLRIIDAQVVLVVSNRKDAFGLERAQKAGVPTAYHPLKPYTDAGRSREEYDGALAEIVAAVRPDLVVLAGWMHILSNAFLNRFPFRVLNLHPALPGAFPGPDAIQDALEAFERGEIRRTGVMVHLVTNEEVDAGPVLLSEEVYIYSNDTLETLEKRIHQVEHKLIVRAIIRMMEGDE